MATLMSPGDRATLTENAQGFVLTVPVQRSLLGQLFLSIWIVGWLFAGSVLLEEFMPPTSLDSFDSLFGVACLAGWGAGLVLAVSNWFWLLAGSERIDIDSSGVAIRRQVFGLGRTHRYAAPQVTAMRFLAPEPPPRNRVRRGRRVRAGRSGLVFNDGQSIVTFAPGIAAPEAGRHLARIERRFPGFVLTEE